MISARTSFSLHPCALWVAAWWSGRTTCASCCVPDTPPCGVAAMRKSGRGCLVAWWRLHVRVSATVFPAHTCHSVVFSQLLYETATYLHLQDKPFYKGSPGIERRINKMEGEGWRYLIVDAVNSLAGCAAPFQWPADAQAQEASPEPRTGRPGKVPLAPPHPTPRTPPPHPPHCARRGHTRQRVRTWLATCEHVA